MPDGHIKHDVKEKKPEATWAATHPAPPQINVALIFSAALIGTFAWTKRLMAITALTAMPTKNKDPAAVRILPCNEEAA